MVIIMDPSKLIFNLNMVQKVKFSSENTFLDLFEIENIILTCPKQFEPVQDNLDGLNLFCTYKSTWHKLFWFSGLVFLGVWIGVPCCTQIEDEKRFRITISIKSFSIFLDLD